MAWSSLSSCRQSTRFVDSTYSPKTRRFVWELCSEPTHLKSMFPACHSTLIQLDPFWQPLSLHVALAVSCVPIPPDDVGSSRGVPRVTLYPPILKLVLLAICIASSLHKSQLVLVFSLLLIFESCSSLLKPHHHSSLLSCLKYKSTPTIHMEGENMVPFKPRSIWTACLRIDCRL